MTVRKLLFLLGGGSAIFDAVAEEFVPAAGGRDSSIALLLAGVERAGKITCPTTLSPGQDGA